LKKENPADTFISEQSKYAPIECNYGNITTEYLVTYFATFSLLLNHLN